MKRTKLLQFALGAALLSLANTPIQADSRFLVDIRQGHALSDLRLAYHDSAHDAYRNRYRTHAPRDRIIERVESYTYYRNSHGGYRHRPNARFRHGGYGYYHGNEWRGHHGRRHHDNDYDEHH